MNEESLIIISCVDDLLKIENKDNMALCLENKNIYSWVDVGDEVDSKWIIYSENNTNLVGIFVYDVEDIRKHDIFTHIKTNSLVNNVYLNGSKLGPKDYMFKKVDEDVILRLTLSYSLDVGDRFVIEYFNSEKDNRIMLTNEMEYVYTGHIIRHDHNHDDNYLKINQNEIRFENENSIEYENDKLYSNNGNRGRIYSENNKPTLEELGLANVEYVDTEVASSIEDLESSHVVDLNLIKGIKDKLLELNNFELNPLDMSNKFMVYSNFKYIEKIEDYNYKLNYIPVKIPYLCDKFFKIKNNLINGESHEKSVTCYPSEAIRKEIDYLAQNEKTSNSLTQIFSYINEYSGQIKLNLKFKVINKLDNPNIRLIIYKQADELESGSSPSRKSFTIDEHGSLGSTFGGFSQDKFYLDGHDLCNDQNTIDEMSIDLSLIQDLSYVFFLRLDFEDCDIEDIDTYFSYNIGSKEGFI